MAASPRKILLLASERWISTGRLALAMQSFGCAVEIMAPRRHPVLRAGIASKTHPYNVLRPVESTLGALRAAQADIVLAVDELTLLHLDELRAAAAASREPSAASMAAMLAASGFGAETTRPRRSRLELLQLAAASGVSIAQTLAVARKEDLGSAMDTLGLPLVLKADASFGGRGVRIVANEEAAYCAWQQLHEPATLTAAVRRGVRWRNWLYLREWALGEAHGISAQRRVEGRERTAMAVLIEGRVEAVVCLEVLEVADHRGPSSALRVVRDEVMEEAVRGFARASQATGFYGFDFIVERTTGVPLLIELNERPTQLVHLPLGAGRDLVAAFLRGVLHMEVQDREAATAGELIALFPQEMLRDPHSQWIREGFHDVPWEAPQLIRAGLKRVPAWLADDPRWR